MATDWSGEFMIRRAWISQEQWEQARRSGSDPIRWLFEAAILDALRYYQVWAMRRGMAFIDIERLGANLQTHHLDPELARRHSALALKRDGNTLWVAFHDPESKEAIRAVEAVTSCRVIPVVALPRAIDEALARLP